MLKGKKYIKTDGGALKFLICLGFSALLMLVCSFIMSIIAANSNDPTGMIGICSLIAMLLSAVGGGIFSVRMKGDGGIPYAILVALGLVLLMLLIAVISCGGKVLGSAFMNYGCYLGVTAMSAFLGKKKTTHRMHKK